MEFHLENSNSGFKPSKPPQKENQLWRGRDYAIAVIRTDSRTFIRFLMTGSARNLWMQPEIVVRTRVMATMAVNCLRLLLRGVPDLGTNPEEWDTARSFKKVEETLKEFVDSCCEGEPLVKLGTVTLNEQKLSSYLKTLRGKFGNARLR